MGYDLHVTRRKQWFDEEGPDITIEEWICYVASDSELELNCDHWGSESAEFVTHPDQWPIWWDKRGEIYAKNPDRMVVCKLVQIAEALGARVLGDDGEVYGIDPQDPTISEIR